MPATGIQSKEKNLMGIDHIHVRDSSAEEDVLGKPLNLPLQKREFLKFCPNNNFSHNNPLF
jgi:hypothetical protein